MTGNPFFDRPILNSPYGYPEQHWELDDQGQPTQKIVGNRRPAEFITPIPKPKKRKGAGEQSPLVFDEGLGLSTARQQYDHTAVINGVRNQVDKWRRLLNPSDWRVTPETARLLQHWRHHNFSGIRPFFCQVEAVETAIWLMEVAPQIGKAGESFVEHLVNASREANPELLRLALKLATGAGKTTVMAMIIAWQSINAVRHPQSKRFTRGFLVVAPGLTIKDRLRVLQPNDPDSYYASRELIPGDMLEEVNRAKIVITNFHAFKLRERIELSKGGRSLLQGRGEGLNTLETEGQMLQRVMPDLMGIKNILVLNDEAHHCYREKADTEDEEELKGDDRKEAEKNKEAARVWINGLEAVNRNLGVARVIDLSATPFFLSGSGYAEGTLFPWTMSDFSLMDAIECGIVKLPRVPVADNIPGADIPMFRNLWEHIGKKMPKNVTPLTVANAQKSYGRLLGQLSGRPQPFTGECPMSIVVNQADQIQVMRHGRELPADGLQRDEQSPIRHKRICRREGSPYNALMVRPHGCEGKICSVKGKCPISRLSQKRAQAIGGTVCNAWKSLGNRCLPSVGQLD